MLFVDTLLIRPCNTSNFALFLLLFFLSDKYHSVDLSLALRWLAIKYTFSSSIHRYKNKLMEGKQLVGVTDVQIKTVLKSMCRSV